MAMDWGVIYQTTIAGILASLACGLGALPLMFKRFDVKKNIGLGYAFAGGLMFAASVYNLIMPGVTMGLNNNAVKVVFLMILGILSGAAFIWFVNRHLTPERLQNKLLSKVGGRTEILIFIAMMFHSIPEGVAVGVGYASATALFNGSNLGHYIALAIALHNIPEGLAVAIPMRSKGASIPKCFFAAFLTSLPQPIAAVPAAILVWFFQPLMVPLLGFAAGAMIYLVLFELIPDALEDKSPIEMAWGFMFGFCMMLLVQVFL